MKILYVSDLDGTLLNSKEKISEYTIKILNGLIKRGMYFTYATARSAYSANIVTSGLLTNIPVIVFGGKMILNTDENNYSCDIIVKKASKARAVKKLNEKLRCDKVIVFGNDVNDISLFKIADESYAVENAEDEIKKYVDATIKSNDEDGVARWLEKNYEKCLTNKYAVI